MLKNALEHPIANISATIVMSVAVALVVSMVGLASGVRHAMQDHYVHRNVSLVVTSDSISPIGSTIPQKAGEAIINLKSVASVCMGLLEIQQVDELGSEPVVIQGWQPGAYMFDELKIVKGANLIEHSEGKRQLLMGNALAAAKKVKIGDKLSLADEKYEIVGIFESSEEIENGMIVTLLKDAQMISGRAGAITGCTVIAKDQSPEGIEAVRAEIEGKIADANNLSGKLRAKQPTGIVKNNPQMRELQTNVWVNSLVALCAAAAAMFGIMVTSMLISVLGRRREIGIFQADSQGPWHALQAIAVESLVLSLICWILGTIGGVCLLVWYRNNATDLGLGVQGILSEIPQIAAIGLMCACFLGAIRAALAIAFLTQAGGATSPTPNE